MATNYQLIH